jgi:pimeloyl-ACP methyl ester carboxylesterase
MTGVTAAPPIDHAIRLDDGRSLAFAEWGDPHGRPVLLFHGRPGSRLLCPDEDATKTERVRLITVDRPGYGRSDPRPGRTLLDWADDVLALADQLELPRFSVIGWSSGGPHALACAARIPERIHSVGLAASSGPLDEVPGEWEQLSAEVRGLVEGLRQGLPGTMEAIERRVSWFADDPDSILGKISTDRYDPDDELLAREDILEPMKVWMREGARQGSAGFVRDWVAEYLPWGFSLIDISHETLVWWGEEDILVRRAHTDYLASALPKARLITHPGEGHLAPLSHWGEMLAALR